MRILVRIMQTTHIKLLSTEFQGWARSAGFVCRRAVGRTFYGSTADGQVRVELVNDGISLRDRYQASVSELDGLFSMEAMYS